MHDKVSKVKMVSKDYKLPLTGLFLLLVVFLSLLNSDAYSGSNEWTKSSNNIPVGSKPNSIAFGLGNIYVTNSGSNTISVIDGKTNKVVATIPVGTSPHGVVALDSPVGGFSTIYVTNSGSNTISVIDGKTNKVVATIPVGSHPNSLYKTSDNRTIYTINTISNTISVIDGKTNKVVATIPVGTSPHDIIGSMLGKLYVTNSGSDNVSVIDGKTNKVVATIPSGNLPNDVASDETYSKIYVTNSGSNKVSVINGISNIGSPQNHYCDTK
jgi:YVTN family beta-propeller protein